MAEMIRSHDWTTNPLGAPENWPTELCLAVENVLNTPFPMAIAWGEEMVQIYNDNYRDLLSSKHPESFARPTREIWAEVWERIEPLCRSVFDSGKPFWQENARFDVNRGTHLRESYFTFAYSPVYLRDGSIGGFQILASETTDFVLSQRRLETIRALNNTILRCDSPITALRQGIEVLGSSAEDIGFALAYGNLDHDEQAHVVASVGIDATESGLPLQLDFSAHPGPLTPFEVTGEMENGHLIEVDHPRCRRAFVSPLRFRTSESPGPWGYFVFGLSDLLSHDQAYLDFVTEVARSITETCSLLLARKEHAQQKVFETELIIAREKAEELSRIKASLLANMSHEVRTPLTSIIGMASVLARQLPPEFQDPAEHIERAGKRLAKTLDSVLTLAQFESGAEPMELAVLNLHSEARAAVSALKPLATEKNLSLELYCADENIAVCADASYLNSIFNNLIGNAIKFTEKGYVLVRVSKDAERGIVEVSDTGPGIDSHFLPVLFDEFRQASSGPTRSHGGVGLGLNIAQRMARALNGTLTVCTTPGGGSSFTLTLPQSASRTGLSKTVPNKSTQAAQTKRPNVLVIEDDRATCAVLQSLLKEHFEVSCAYDGSTGALLAREQDFTLILVDIGLPDISGVELIEELRGVRDYCERPIVAISGFTSAEDRNRCQAAGFDEFIAKPFLTEELLERIYALLD